jgi:hypothetical protein
MTRTWVKVSFTSSNDLIVLRWNVTTMDHINDPHFKETISDVLILFHPNTHAPLTLYAEHFLSRWYRRLQRHYPNADAFAAAAVGARRLVQHLGHSLDHCRVLEKILARTVAGLVLEARAAVEALQQRRLEVHRIPPAEREMLVERMSVDLIRRADGWTPEMATQAAELRKKRPKERFLSAFEELEKARAAVRQHGIDQRRRPSVNVYQRRPSVLSNQSTVSQRRPSAEERLQSVLAECEFMMDKFNVQ